jgi:hypothetical protein
MRTRSDVSRTVAPDSSVRLRLHLTHRGVESVLENKHVLPAVRE